MAVNLHCFVQFEKKNENSLQQGQYVNLKLQNSYFLTSELQLICHNVISIVPEVLLYDHPENLDLHVHFRMMWKL